MEKIHNFTSLNYINENNSVVTENDPLWIVFMDQSQLIMTIIGLVANIATSVTLIKKGQVRATFYSLFIMDYRIYQNSFFWNIVVFSHL